MHNELEDELDELSPEEQAEAEALAIALENPHGASGLKTEVAETVALLRVQREAGLAPTANERIWAEVAEGLPKPAGASSSTPSLKLWLLRLASAGAVVGLGTWILMLPESSAPPPLKVASESVATGAEGRGGLPAPSRRLLVAQQQLIADPQTDRVVFDAEMREHRQQVLALLEVR